MLKNVLARGAAPLDIADGTLFYCVNEIRTNHQPDTPKS